MFQSFGSSWLYGSSANIQSQPCLKTRLKILPVHVHRETAYTASGRCGPTVPRNAATREFGSACGTCSVTVAAVARATEVWPSRSRATCDAVPPTAPTARGMRGCTAGVATTSANRYGHCAKLGQFQSLALRRFKRIKGSKERGKIQGDGRKFLDRFKSYFGSQTSPQSLNEIHIYRSQPKSATKGDLFIFIYFCL